VGKYMSCLTIQQGVQPMDWSLPIIVELYIHNYGKVNHGLPMLGKIKVLEKAKKRKVWLIMVHLKLILLVNSKPTQHHGNEIWIYCLEAMMTNMMMNMETQVKSNKHISRKDKEWETSHLLAHMSTQIIFVKLDFQVHWPQMKLCWTFLKITCHEQ
jgi:hypothetical protein